MFDLKFESFCSHWSAIELVNGFLGALWTVLFALILGVIVANKAELTKVVLLYNERLDASERFEVFAEIFLSPCWWDVLDIDVVDQFSERSSVLWLELHDMNTIFFWSFESVVSSFLLLEADEAIAS